MKNEKNHSLYSLINLYLGHIFQKSTIIVLLISILFMVIASYLVSNPWMNEIDYISSPKDFHMLYMSQSMLLIQIFNAIICTTLVINITLNSTAFDILFVSYISRRRLCIAKILSLGFIIIILAMLEVLFVYLIGLLRYSKFVFEIEILKSLGNIFITMIFSMLFSISMTTIVPIIFVPMVILLINIVFIIICNNYSHIGDKITSIIPVLKLNDEVSSFQIANPLISIILCILLFFLYISIYEIKDLKY